METMGRYHPLIKIGHHLLLLIGCIFSGIILVSAVILAAYQLAYDGTILPRVMISGIEVSNMTREGAKNRILLEFSNSPNRVQMAYRGEILAESTSLSASRDIDWAIEQAWGIGRSGNPLTKLSERIKMFFEPKTIDLPINYDIDALDGIISRVVARINQEGVFPMIKSDPLGEIKIEPGVDGLMVDEDELRTIVVEAMKKPGNFVVEVPTKVVSSAIDNSRITGALEIANKWKGKTLRLFYDKYSTTLKSEAIYRIIGLSQNVVNEDEIDKVLESIRPAIEKEAKNAIFNFDQDRVVEFSPEVSGISIDEKKFRTKLGLVVVSSSTNDLEIPVVVSEAKVKAGDINGLGIKTLIGVGTSKFNGSIANRIHNLTLASRRLNGAIVAPGETFSLGQTIGDVSRATGYREAYVISGGRTVLGDGGGVCQVSTTLFRAALNAGLPIVERKSHAYRVHYYEEDMGPGYDATVFFPSADLKFINDTPGHVLVQTRVDQKNLSMRYEIYGTDDGRVASISAAKMYSQTRPLPTVYQDDPTLAQGKTKQIDWSAWGAKVSFDYKVTRGSEVLQDRTFYSTYQPWAAVYLRGTGSLATN